VALHQASRTINRIIATSIIPVTGCLRETNHCLQLILKAICKAIKWIHNRCSNQINSRWVKTSIIHKSHLIIPPWGKAKCHLWIKLMQVSAQKGSLVWMITAGCKILITQLQQSSHNIWWDHNKCQGSSRCLTQCLQDKRVKVHSKWMLKEYKISIKALILLKWARNKASKRFQW